jgi:hypothetical protein
MAKLVAKNTCTHLQRLYLLKTELQVGLAKE